MVKWILIAVLALPVAEIGVFILVVASIGLIWALGLLLATTIAGFVVLHMAGRGRFALFRRTVAGAGLSGIEARLEANPHGFLVILGGILLVLPGFITDVIGAILLLAPIRQWCGERFHRAAGSHRPASGEVIDLAKSEWKRLPEGKLENKRGRSDIE